MLLRVASDGSISRMVVTGRVLFGEKVREALMRHCEKDLGPMALPRVPADPTPFTVVEYFPNPDRSGFYDPRHHAVSLAYVVPVDGECEPTQEALDLGWYTPEEAVSSEVIAEMTNGHDRLIRLALAHVGKLPVAVARRVRTRWTRAASTRMMIQIVTMPAASESDEVLRAPGDHAADGDGRDLLAGDPADALTTGEQVDGQRRQTAGPT